MKEKFSDGCGFTYVPNLLNYLSDGASLLSDRLKKEKQYVLTRFDSFYPGCRHLIVERTMPAWAQMDESDNMLLSNV
jgi:hypothetical protein